jgi:hypothetical protein
MRRTKPRGDPFTTYGSRAFANAVIAAIECEYAAYKSATSTTKSRISCRADSARPTENLSIIDL